MYLSSLSLTNIRQFEHRTFEFHPGFNLLVGENGAGKTTILRGLIATIGETREGVRVPLLNDEDIRLQARNAEARAEIHFQSRSEQFFLRKTLWGRVRRSHSGKNRPLVLLYASNEATCSAMKVKRAKRIRGSEGEQLRRSEEFLYERELEPPRLQNERQGQRFGNSHSVRVFIGKVLSTFASDFQDFHWRFEPYDCSLIPAGDASVREPLGLRTQARAFAMRYFHEEWSRGRKRALHWPDRPKVVLTSEPLEREGYRLPHLKEIWSGMKLSSEERIFLQTCSLEVRLTPRIMIRRNVGPLSLSQLSDGEQRLFSLFADIARQLSLRDPDKAIGRGEAIVLIDEIDVHLHPKWQRKIVPALEGLFRGCQFIATTHSPFVIQAVAAHNLQHIDRGVMGETRDRGIEEIAVRVMGIMEPEVGARYLEMLDAAKDYFRMLDGFDGTNEEQRRDLKARLGSLSRRYADNPAYQAYLEIHQQLRLGPDELR